MKLNAISLNADIPVSAVGVETIANDYGKRLPANPFVGLRPFESDESFLFFGRDQQILRLLQQLQSNHFLAVVGSSGCGKSSLIRAGLIPKLKAGFLIERRDHWRVAIMKPGESPLTNLSKTLLGLASEFAGPDEIAAFAGQLRVSGAQAATKVLREPLKAAEANVLLVVDQFEELFRYDQPQVRVVREGEDDAAGVELSIDEIQRAESAKRELRRDQAAKFVSIVLELARQRELPIYVVMTMRSDFLGDCDAFHGLPETINETVYLVPRLNRQQRMEAIEKPIRLYGQDITSRLLDLVANDVGDESDQLPVMQHALMRTWEKWKQNEADTKAIDLPDYEAAKMISGALSRDAEIALNELAEDEGTIAKRMFQALVETDAQGRNVRRPAHLTQLAGIAGVPPTKVLEVIDHFRRDGRCFLTLTSERVEDDPLVDISHESLIRQWEQLGKWVKSENYSKEQYTRLADAAQRHSVNKGSLFTGTDLQLAVDWWEKRKPNEAWSLRYNRDFHIAEKFLAESKAQSDKERAEIENRRVKEVETVRIQHQNKKLRRMMFALGACLLAALLGAGGTAYSGIRASRSLKEAMQLRDEARKKSEFAFLESVRANSQADIAQRQAARADQARYEALQLTNVANRETERANREAQLATERLGQIQRAQRALQVASKQKEQALTEQRKKLIDQLGTNYLKALSLAVTPDKIEEAVLTYEDILKVYNVEGARGGSLSTLLVLGRLFDGSLSLNDSQRALDYYERSLTLFDQKDYAERAKKQSTLIKMGDLLSGEKLSQEAAARFEEAISLGYEPAIDESRSVYRKLGDLYDSQPGSQSLAKARDFYERELSHLNRRIAAKPKSTGSVSNKVATLIKLGTVQLRLGNKEAANERYEQAIDLATGPVLELAYIDPLVRIGASLNRPEEKSQREAFFKRAVESAGYGDTKADAYKKVGDALNTAQQYQEALEYLKEAESGYGTQETKLAATFRSMALAYEELGDKENALAYYGRALAIYQKLKYGTVVTSLKYRIQQLNGRE